VVSDSIANRWHPLTPMRGFRRMWVTFSLIAVNLLVASIAESPDVDLYTPSPYMTQTY